MDEEKEIRALKLSVFLYVVVLLLKFAAFYMTGVLALFAEALHTLSDIFISGFLLVALVWSKKKADKTHLFGHRRAQNVAALVAATLFISFTAYKLYEEGIPRLFAPHEAEYSHLEIALGVLAVSILIAAAPMISLIRQKTKGPAAKAQYMELINDQMGLIAALIGTLFVIEGWYIADALATVFVATIISINAIGLLRENASMLLGRSPEPAFFSEVERICLSVKGVLGVHAIKAEIIGPSEVSAGLHIAVARGTPIEEADRIAHEVEEKIKKGTECRECVIHVGPVD